MPKKTKLLFSLLLAALLAVRGVSSAAFPALEEFPGESFQHYLKYLLYQKADRPDKALTELVLAYQSNPDAHELLQPIVSLALEMRLLEIAQIYSRRALAVAPEDVRSLLVAAQVMEAEGNSDEALILLNRAYKIEPKNPGVLLELAAIHAELGHKREAGRFMDLYLGVAPGSIDLLKLKANFEMQDKNPKALKSYREAFEAAPEDPEILEGLVASYRMFSSTAALTQVLSEAAQKDPENHMAALKLCQIQEGMSERRDCYEGFLLAKPNIPAAVVGLLETYEQEERWDEALEVLRERRAAFAEDPAPYLKESFYLLRLNRDEEALAALETGVKEYPQHDSLAYFLALGYQDLGRWSDAKTQLEKVYNRYPQWKEPAYNYALACGELEETAVMEKVLAGLWKDYPNDPVILNALGYTWAEQGKELEQAKSLIEKALIQEPGNPSYVDSMAWVTFKSGDARKAKEILEPAIRENTDPEMWIHWSQILSALSDTKGAWQAYYSAYFELESRKNPGSRLRRHLAKLSKSLPVASRPDARGVLGGSATSLDKKALQYRCDWNVPQNPDFRSRMILTRSEESRKNLRLLMTLPGALVPVNTHELSHLYPQASQAVEELEGGLQDFFITRSWTESSGPKPPKPWRFKEDFSVRLEGRHVTLEIRNFYSLQDRTLAPRNIQLQSRGVKGVCEAMDE